jgi:hypothetical protein
MENLAEKMRLWLKQKSRLNTYNMTEWHIETVKGMAQSAGVSESKVMREAVSFLAINFEREMFVTTKEYES